MSEDKVGGDTSSPDKSVQKDVTDLKNEIVRFDEKPTS